MPRHSFFDDVIDRPVWERIQAQLATALRMEIHTLGPDGQDLCPPSGLTSFRRYLNESSALRKVVPSSRQWFIRRTDELREIVVDESMTYRLHFSVPILFDDEQIATVYGGGTVPEPMPPERVRRLAERFGLDETELARVAAELPVADRNVVLAAAQVIESLLARIIAAVEQKERAGRQARRFEMLAKVGHAVTATLDLLSVLDAVVAAIPEVMDSTAAVVALLDEQDHTLRVRVGWGVSDEYLKIQFGPGQGLFGYVAQTGQAVNVPDMALDPRNAHAEADAREGLRALLAVPLRDGDQVVGVVGAFHAEAHWFTPDDQWVLQTFADYAATAVRNARLYQEVRQAYRELGAANRLLSEAQDRLLQSDRLAQLGLVAGGAAHEMKNALGGIIGAAATVRDRLGELSDDDVRELLAGIAEECWRLKETVETVRQHAKPIHFGFGRHRLLDVITDAVRLLGFDPQLHQIPFQVECDGRIELVCDRDRLKQVLVNLLRNAAEAALTVPDRAPSITVRGAASDGEVKIDVADNGPGIPAELVQRIWDPFFSTKGESGTGLGLDTVRQIVERHGGTIAVTSRPGEGATFTITLPREAPATEGEGGS